MVKSFLAGDGGAKLLWRQWSVPEEKIRTCVSHYRLHGIDGLRRKRSVYSAQFKLQVLSLLAPVYQADFGVAIAHPDDIVRSRRHQTAAPRDNVIFELGFFMSRLGRSRTFLLVPKMDEELKLPSDFKGMTPITYKPLTRKPGEVASALLADTIYQLEQKVVELGCRIS